MLIILPAVIALSAYFITKNPHFRPLGITYEKLAEAGLIATSGEIVALISIGSQVKSNTQKNDIRNALNVAFDRYNAKVRVKFRDTPSDNTVSVTYIVGRSQIGPYPFSQAAKGIKASVRAERMVKAHAEALEKELARKQTQSNSGSWFRVFDN
ncbi:hypothetical protein [Pacificibacter maritimus]|nr:hypothetical protein [Pacificibacter maritimus]